MLKDVRMTKQRLALQKANNSLKTENAFLKTIIQGSRDAIFLADTDALFTFVNQAASELTGYTRDALLQMRIPDLHAADDLHAFNQFFNRIIEGKSLTSRADILRKNGTKIPIEFNNSCV